MISLAFSVVIGLVGFGRQTPGPGDVDVSRASLPTEDVSRRDMPPAIRAATVEERLGSRIPLDMTFTSHAGGRVELASLFEGERPVVLVLAYYRCPMLCGLVLRGMATSLGQIDWQPGADYELATISFDPEDTPAKAEHGRATTVQLMRREIANHSWPFLVGDQADVQRLADALGFRFQYDEETQQYAHPAVVFVLTADGRISRYLYGLEVPALDYRMALIEAGRGRIGSLVERVLVTCYRYDPAQRRYGFYVVGFLRLGGVVLLAILAGLFVTMWRHERKRAASDRRAREGESGGRT